MASGHTNGTPEGPKTRAMDAHQQNGSIYGSPDTSRSTRSSRSKRKTRGTYTGWAVDKGAKILVWYCLITAVFRCPASKQDITGESPAICKPYLQAKYYIQPHTQPYYDQYLAPHVQKAQPYVDHVHQRVYQPALVAYQQHGAPRVQQAQAYGQEQWVKTVKPQLDVARHQAGKQYDAVLGPHVKKAQGVVQPYYDSVKTSASDIWELEVQPVYRNTAPYAQKVYTHGRQFAVDTALPQAQYASNAAYAFWIRQIWPKMRVLYGENVEPQLMRITERLGRYKDEKKVQADVKSAETSSSLSSAATAASSVVSQSTQSVEPREQFLADLESWKSVCHTAVDEGAEHLRERISEIAQHQISSQAEGVGNALVTQLEQTVDGSLYSIKATTLSIVAGIPEKDPNDTDFDNAHGQLSIAIRHAGQSVKRHAQAIRAWRQQYDAETSDLAQKALQSTLETIDSIRELRLTEIGRKYASSSLPHKDWAKYNDLKKATQDWRNDVGKVVEESQAIKSAEDTGKKVEGHGMSIAEDAAKELSRLKEVGKWKIESQDASDDFESKTMPPSARRVKKAVEENFEAASNAVLGTEAQDTVESATSSVADRASNVASSASEAVIGSSTGSLESAAGGASSLASSAVVGTPSDLSDSATDLASSFSSALPGSETPVTESISSASSSLGPKAASIIAEARSSKDGASSSVVSVGDRAASVVSDASADFVDPASSSASSAASAVTEAVPGTDDISTGAAKASSRVIGGAMAQSVPSSGGPILEGLVDDFEESTKSVGNKAQSVAGDAQQQFALLTKAIADAMKPSATSQGVVESATSLASEQYEFAMSAASSAYYGTKPNVVSKGSQAAKDQYLAAVTAASYAIYGTPTTAAAASSATSLAVALSSSAGAVAAAASSSYDEAVSQAGSHLEAAKSRLLVQISGTPKPVHEQMYASIDSAYSDAVSAASSRLNGAMGALPTGSGFLGGSASQGVYESISSVASARLQEGLSAASTQYQSAKIAVGAEPTPAHQAYLASAQRAYYEGIGLAHDRYSSFVDAAKGAVGATPTPAYQAYLDAAQSSYSAAVAAASSNYQGLLGAASATSKTPAQSVMDEISSRYSAAVAAASSQLAAASSQASSAAYGSSTGSFGSASSVVSEAVYGSQPAWTDDVASQASANWDALIARASSQVYGAPPPFTDSVYSQAGAYAAQATMAAAQQYEAVQSLFSELVNGREPDFTESVMSRLSSAYSTGAPQMASAASSYANGAYGSASSVITSVFTAPPTIEAVLQSVTDQLNSAVDAASAQFQGSTKGSFESATSAAASAYENAASQASEAVYGHETGYAEAASSSFSLAAESASRAISEALFGSSAGTAAAATDGAASAYSSVSSAAVSQAAAVSSAVSSAIYGPEKGAMESAQGRILAAVESARSRVGAFAASATGAAADSAAAAQAAVESVASDFSKGAAKATAGVKDEL